MRQCWCAEGDPPSTGGGGGAELEGRALVSELQDSTRQHGCVPAVLGRSLEQWQSGRSTQEDDSEVGAHISEPIPGRGSSSSVSACARMDGFDTPSTRRFEKCGCVRSEGELPRYRASTTCRSEPTSCYNSEDPLARDTNVDTTRSVDRRLPSMSPCRSEGDKDFRLPTTSEDFRLQTSSASHSFASEARSVLSESNHHLARSEATFQSQSLVEMAARQADRTKDAPGERADLSDLLRAIPSRRLLLRWRIFEQSAGGEETFELSQRVDQVRFFLSHSWQTPGWLKMASLMYELNVLRAAIACLIAHVSVHVMESAGVLMLPVPVVAEFCLPAGDVKYCARCGLHLLVACLVFVLVLLLGQVVPFSSSLCFLDKCCIHQLDVLRKERSLQQLGTILSKSEYLLILWQPEYFTRLWCVYELAAFVHANQGSGQRVLLRPLKLLVFVVVLCLFHGVVGIASIALLPLTVAAEWHVTWILQVVPPQSQYLYLFFAFFIGFFFVYLLPSAFFWKFCKGHMRDRRALIQQLLEFRVATAECHEAKDKKFIEEDIVRWFGSKHSFEGYVNVTLAEQVSNVIQKEVPIPYRMVLVGTLGHILMCTSYAVAFYEAGGASEAFWHIVMAACLLVFCADAVATNLVLRLANTSFGEHESSGPLLARKAIGPVTTACIFAFTKATCGGLITPSCPKWWAAMVIAVMMLVTLCLYRRSSEDTAFSEQSAALHSVPIPLATDNSGMGPAAREDGRVPPTGPRAGDSDLVRTEGRLVWSL